MCKSILRFTFFSLLVCRGYTQDINWEPYRPHTHFFTMLTAADSTTFIHEFEYPLLLIFTEEEKQQYLELGSVSDRKKFIERYVRRKNQNPLFPVNYWLLELWGRYWYARRNFRIADPPYFDERGVYCVKFGIPDDRYKDPGGLKFVQLFRSGRALQVIRELYDKTPPPMEFHIKPNETWYYVNRDKNFVVHFVEKGKGYKKVESLEQALHSARKRNVGWQWMELVKERESISSEYAMMSETIRQFEDIFRTARLDTIGTRDADDAGGIMISWPKDVGNIIPFDGPHGYINEEKRSMESFENRSRSDLVPNVSDRFKELNKLDFYNDIAQFRNDDGKTRVELVQLVPLDEFVKMRVWPNPSDNMAIKYQYMIRDQSFNPYMNVEFEDKFLLSKIKETGLRNVLFKVIIPMQPMAGDLTMQITDVYSDNRGFIQKPLVIRDFTGDKLMLSDIQLYKNVDDDALKKILPVSVIENVTVSSYPYREIRRSEPLVCYFEIYNLFALRPIDTYEIEIILAHEESRKGLRRLFGGPPEYEISTMHSRGIDKNDSHELIALDLSKLKNGEYTLKISIIHPQSKNVITSSGKSISIRD